MARSNVKNPSGYHSSGRTLLEKAVNFGMFIKPFDWSGGWETLDNGNVKLTATRGENEQIVIEWYNPRGGVVWYSLAGSKMKLRNVSAAALIAQNQPDPSRLKRVVRKRRNLDAPSGEPLSAESVAELQGSLPFDHESSDEDLKVVLLRKTISWVNRYSGQIESARVGRRHFKVSRNGHDYVNFIDMDGTGFRAVYLDSIVSVG